MPAFPQARYPPEEAYNLKQTQQLPELGD